jgi:hypothetical protein
VNGVGGDASSRMRAYRAREAAAGAPRRASAAWSGQPREGADEKAAAEEEEGGVQSQGRRQQRRRESAGMAGGLGSRRPCPRSTTGGLESCRHCRPRRHPWQECSGAAAAVLFAVAPDGGKDGEMKLTCGTGTETA